jgi:NADPH2:quinone reductase
VPGPGQVLIDVHIANITFVETQVCAGRAPNQDMLPRLPAILGNGVGGGASVAGDADPALVGRQVITTTGGCAPPPPDLWSSAVVRTAAWDHKAG